MFPVVKEPSQALARWTPGTEEKEGLKFPSLIHTHSPIDNISKLKKMIFFPK